MSEPPAHRTAPPYGPERGLYLLAPDIHKDSRVSHPEYGEGTVVAFLPTGVQIQWDRPQLEGVTGPQFLIHDPPFVATLERLPAQTDATP